MNEDLEKNSNKKQQCLKTRIFSFCKFDCRNIKLVSVCEVYVMLKLLLQAKH